MSPSDVCCRAGRVTQATLAWRKQQYAGESLRGGGAGQAPTSVPSAEPPCGAAAGQPGRKFFDQLVRVRLSDETPDLFTLPRGEFFGGEPVYIEGPQPEDALILVERLAAQSAFALFRANRIADGPVAEIPLTTKLLPGFHAAFSPREDAAR